VRMCAGAGRGARLPWVWVRACAGPCLLVPTRGYKAVICITVSGMEPSAFAWLPFIASGGLVMNDDAVCGIMWAQLNSPRCAEDDGHRTIGLSVMGPVLMNALSRTNSPACGDEGRWASKGLQYRRPTSCGPDLGHM
jgi:hypothetical protein